MGAEQKPKLSDGWKNMIQRELSTLRDLTRAHVTEFRGPMTIKYALEFSAASHVATDLAISRILKSGPADGRSKVSCLGCRSGSCCTIPPEAGIADGLVAVAYLDHERRLTSDLFSYLRRRHEDEVSCSRTEWFGRQIPCPFLDSGSCSIYSARPVSCRCYYVVSEPALCGDPACAEKTVAIDMQFAKLRPGAMESVLQMIGGWKETVYQSTLPGAIWSIGRNWWCRDDWRSFQRRVQRDWLTYPRLSEDEPDGLIDKESKQMIEEMFTKRKEGGS